MRFLEVIKRHRRLLLGIIDFFVIFISSLITMPLVNGTMLFLRNYTEGVLHLGIYSLIYIFVMYFLGIYHRVWRYASLKDILSIIMASCITAILCLPMAFGGRDAVHFVIISAVLGTCAIIFTRLIYVSVMNTYRSAAKTSTSKTRKILIIGAGYAGVKTAQDFQRNPDRYEVVGFVDDDPEKIGRSIYGIKVLASCSEIPSIVEEKGVDSIALVIPSISPEEKSRIIGICSETVCDVRVLPAINDMMSLKDGVRKRLVPIKIEDLLGREQVRFDNHEVMNLISGRVCMVTGGGGSIGSELSRQIASYKPNKLIIVDIYENNAYDIQQELSRTYKDKLDLNIEIASVRDKDKLETLFQKYKPQVVFHAAAHKHVPLMETNPEEAVKNNIFGTFNTAKLSMEYGVEKFVLVSTDKAVNPTNIMGATKRFCEMIVEYFAQKKPKTEFVAVRFGNVLGSNGSVIPLFEKQIAMGGPVTVTHPDIVRYFMTIPEAVSLILQAATLARGGEIFVLDMGEPVKILDLAKKMLVLHGKRIGEDIDIEFTGLRPGEKLYEELLMLEEGLKKTSNHKIYIGNQIEVNEEEFLGYLSALGQVAMDNDKEKVEEILHKAVPTFVRAKKEKAV